MANILDVKDLHVGINKKEIVHGISFAIPEGKLSAIIGPNGCGKSTTLKALARIWGYTGSISFKGKDLRGFSQKEFARSLAILTQSPQAPTDLTVSDLVDMGRFPYRSFLGRAKKEDAEYVEWALEQTNMLSMRHRLLSTLSGGERQRAWIAMALAQNPQVLLLDEPTTYLDICHQLEIMQLLERLNKELGLTVVMVLHDLNHTLQYTEHVIVMRQGALVTSGDPAAIITPQLLEEVYRVEAEEFRTKNGTRVLMPMDLKVQENQD